MPTIKEISDEYGVSKSTMRRWIKECMPDLFDGKRLNLNESQMHELADFIAKNKSNYNKDKVIDVTFEETTESENKAFNEPIYEAIDSATLNRINELEAENTYLEIMNGSLQREIDSLKRENELLLDRLKVADAALEREQMQARGFWSRLGQKLLGKGKKD